MQPFAQKLHLSGNRLNRRAVDVLQVNMGRYCNQACIHCHVESGPNRKEMMSLETVDAVLRFLAATNIPTVDITGGAPELNPHFDYLVESAVGMKRHVMDRCNLTVVFEPGKEYLPEFFRRNRVELVCSLPCYSEENVDRQRGKGTFDLSIRALQIFNRLGYGQPESDLILKFITPSARTCRRRKTSSKKITSESYGIDSILSSIISIASATCRSRVMKPTSSCAASMTTIWNF
jgi:radical SAM/Cys-rich protein